MINNKFEKTIFKIFDDINKLNNYNFNKNRFYNVILNIKNNNYKDRDKCNYKELENRHFNVCFNGKLTINVYFDLYLRYLNGVLDIDELEINNYLYQNIHLNFDTTIKKLNYNYKYEYLSNSYNGNEFIIKFTKPKQRILNSLLYLKGRYMDLKELNITNIKKLNLKFCDYNNFKLTNNYLMNYELNVNNNLKINYINLINYEITYNHNNIINLNENKQIDVNYNLIIKSKKNNDIYLNVKNNLSNIKLIGIFNDCIFNDYTNKLILEKGNMNNLIGKFNEIVLDNFGNNIKNIICEVNKKCEIYCNKINYINGIFRGETNIYSNEINNLCGDYNELTILNCRKINLDKIKNINSLTLRNCNIKKIQSNLFNIKKLKLENCNINEICDNLINLETLEINRCNNLKSIPNTFINLKSLKLYNCNNIKELDNNYINLKNLDISFCKNLKKLNGFKNVKNLIIEGNYIQQINNFDNLINLEIFNLYYYYPTIPNLNLNSYINSCNNIKKLILRNCDGIKYLNDKLINLEELKILNCENIKTIPETLINLKKLKLYNCKNIKIPKTINCLKLERCNNIILDDNFEKLEKIEICNCHNIKINPINTLLNVRYLKIYNCYDIDFISNDLIDYNKFKISYKYHYITELKDIFSKLEKLEIQ